MAREMAQLNAQINEAREGEDLEMKIIWHSNATVVFAVITTFSPNVAGSAAGGAKNDNSKKWV